MKNWLVSHLKGRSTYLVAALMVLTMFVLVGTRHLTPATAAMILVGGSAAFGATFRATLERHHAELISVLLETAGVGIAVSAQQLPAAVTCAEKAAIDGAHLANEIRQECQQEKA